MNWKKTTKRERKELYYHSTGFISSSVMKTDKETGLGYGTRPFMNENEENK
jgi:hypothetical protein